MYYLFTFTSKQFQFKLHFALSLLLTEFKSDEVLLFIYYDLSEFNGRFSSQNDQWSKWWKRLINTYCSCDKANVTKLSHKLKTNYKNSFEKSS